MGPHMVVGGGEILCAGSEFYGDYDGPSGDWKKTVGVTTFLGFCSLMLSDEQVSFVLALEGSISRVKTSRYSKKMLE